MNLSEMSYQSIILLFVIAVLIILLLKYKYKEYSKIRKQKKRFARGLVLENEARSFLEKKGYKVIAEQPEFYHEYEVDGVSHKSLIKPDYIVSRKGKKYIVEVKSGKSAILISNSATRRQILEYDFVIENDGIFLLDMENKKLQNIQFFTKEVRKDKSVYWILFVVALLGIIAPYWYLKLVSAVILFLYLFGLKNIKALILKQSA
ncbi:MAG: hypothetical protein DSY76_07685 [Bacteroidetes bacterium]|nr:MAG: hypothetical protein DSY76_07685 [Bacteroidota bacterium]